MARIRGRPLQKSGRSVPLLLERPVYRRRRVVRGALPGNIGLPGVLAANGWSFSRWFDADRRGPWWGEAVPGVPRCLPSSGWPPWGPCHVCAAVCRRISAAVPLPFLVGPPAGMVAFHCP